MTGRRSAAPAFLLVLILAVVFALDLDHSVARFAATAGPATLAIFRFVTWFGQGWVVLVPSGLVLLMALWLKPRLPSLAGPLRRTIECSALLFVAVAVAGLANDAIKVLLGRARPGLWLHGDISGFYFWRTASEYQSFPSGHTATSVAAAIVLGVLFPRWRVALAIFAVLIAASRIALDAHYLSDVVAGAAVGAMSATLVLAWFRGRGWLSAPSETAE